MRFLQLLESGGFSIEMSSKKAKNAAGTSVAHVINLAVWDIVLAQVCPHIILQPESHGCRDGPLGFEGVTASTKPLLGAQLGFLRHGGDDRNTPSFLGVFLHGLFLHFVAAACAYFEGSAKHILPLFGQMKAAGTTIAADTVNLFQHLCRVATLDSFNPFGLFLSDDGIAALLNNLAEGHLWPDPRYVGDRFHELADFREFEAGIRKDGRHIRVHFAHDMQKDG